MYRDRETVHTLELLADNLRHQTARATMSTDEIAMIEQVANNAVRIADALLFHMGHPSKMDWTGYSLLDLRNQATLVEEELTAALANIRARYGL